MKYKFRNGFSMIEIIVTIAVATSLTVFGIIEMGKSNFSNEMNKFNTNINAIFSNAIMSGIGYASGTGYPCSSGGNYFGIDANRTMECVKWKNFQVVNITAPIPYNYLQGLIKGYGGGSSNSACTLQLQEGTTIDQFFAYINCSKLSFDNAPRNKGFMEELIESNIKSTFPTKYVNIYKQALDVNTTIGGTLNDGKILILMQN